MGEPYFAAIAEKTASILRILSCLFPPPSHIMVSQGEEVNAMTARERILALRLLQKQEENPEYAKRIGIQVDLLKKDPEIKEDKNV